VSSEGWIGLPTVARSMTGQAHLRAERYGGQPSACIDERRLEAPPGFEPGMEVLRFPRVGYFVDPSCLLFSADVSFTGAWALSDVNRTQVSDPRGSGRFRGLMGLTSHHTLLGADQANNDVNPASTSLVHT
jgi:hypothetical protein